MLLYHKLSIDYSCPENLKINRTWHFRYFLPKKRLLPNPNPNPLIAVFATATSTSRWSQILQFMFSTNSMNTALYVYVGAVIESVISKIFSLKWEYVLAAAVTSTCDPPIRLIYNIGIATLLQGLIK